MRGPPTPMKSPGIASGTGGLIEDALGESTPPPSPSQNVPHRTTRRSGFSPTPVGCAFMAHPGRPPPPVGCATAHRPRQPPRATQGRALPRAGAATADVGALGCHPSHRISGDRRCKSALPRGREGAARRAYALDSGPDSETPCYGRVALRHSATAVLTYHQDVEERCVADLLNRFNADRTYSACPGSPQFALPEVTQADAIA